MTKSNKGMIELFYDEEESIIETNTKKSGLAPYVKYIVDHKKYPGEKCHIIDYKNGWTMISYSGVTITIPTKFIKFFESDDNLQKGFKPNKRKIGEK